MKTLLPLWSLWAVLLVTDGVVCFPGLENNDARIGNFIDDGIAEEELPLSDTDLVNPRTVTVPEISLHLQPPEQEFQVMVKNVPSDDISIRNKWHLKKSSSVYKVNSQPSIQLELPTSEFGSISKKTVKLTTSLPNLKRHKSTVRSDSEMPLAAGNTEAVGPASVVKMPLDDFYFKMQKSSHNQKTKMPTVSLMSKKHQKPTQLLEPPTRDLGDESHKLGRLMPSSVSLPASYLLPPTREFAGSTTRHLVPPTRELTLPVRVFAIPPTVEQMPTTRTFSPITREMIPPYREFAAPPPRALHPPTKHFFMG